MGMSEKKSLSKNETQVLEGYCAVRKVKGCCSPDQPVPAACGSTCLPVAFQHPERAIRNSSVENDEEGANTDGAFSTKRGKTRMNEIAARMKHLQSFAVFKATVMFLT